MPIWYPPPKVGKKELIGRRLLDKAGNERETDNDGRPLCLLGDFYETRVEVDLSVDRLGDPNLTPDTRRALSSLADTEASRPERNCIFKGWATIRLDRLVFPGWVAQITATPTKRDDGTIENHWHADANRDGFREKAQAYTFAATLQHTFVRKGGYEPSSRR